MGITFTHKVEFDDYDCTYQCLFLVEWMWDDCDEVLILEVERSDVIKDPKPSDYRTVYLYGDSPRCVRENPCDLMTDEELDYVQECVEDASKDQPWPTPMEIYDSHY